MLGNGVGHGVGLFSQIAFARFLGVESYGLLALALSFILFPSKLMDLGVTTSTPRFIALSLGENDIAKALRIIWQSGLYQGASSLVLTALVLLGASQVGHWMDMPRLGELVLCLGLFAPGVFLFRWSASVLKGLGHNTLQVYLDSFFLQVFTFILGLGGWYLTKSALGVTVGYGGAYLLTGIMGGVGVWRALRALPRPEGRSDFRFMEMIRHGIPLNITALAQIIFQRTDLIIVGAMLDARSVGIYRVASSVAGGLKRLLTPLNDFAVFKMSKYVGMKKNDFAFSHYMDIVLVSLTVALPLYMVLFLFAGEIIVLLYKAEYIESVPLLRVLIVGHAVFVGVGPMGALFNAMGKNVVRMIFVISMSVLNIVLNIVLIHYFGIIGCTYSTTTGFIILFAVFQFYIRRQFLGMTVDLPPLMFMAASGLALALAAVVPGGSMAVRVATALAACGLTAATGVLLLMRTGRDR